MNTWWPRQFTVSAHLPACTTLHVLYTLSSVLVHNQPKGLKPNMSRAYIKKCVNCYATKAKCCSSTSRWKSRTSGIDKQNNMLWTSLHIPIEKHETFYKAPYECCMVCLLYSSSLTPSNMYCRTATSSLAMTFSCVIRNMKASSYPIHLSLFLSLVSSSDVQHSSSCLHIADHPRRNNCKITLNLTVVPQNPTLSPYI